MKSDLIAVVDVETTGLNPKRHDRIVELGIVVIDSSGSVCFEYETLVNPDRDLGPTNVHQISAGEVLQAPTFRQIAGDVLRILSPVSVIAGHNISFDKRFLMAEFERVGFPLPDFVTFCTCQHLGRQSLDSCCREMGLDPSGQAHCAISDAYNTATLVSRIFADDHEIFESFRVSGLVWPSIPALKTTPLRRDQAQATLAEPPKFLQRISAKLRHDDDTDPTRVPDYLVLIDRILEDRVIDSHEEETLVAVAEEWNLSIEQINHAHKQYLYRLSLAALDDGIVTQSEMNDLYLVAQLLGQDAATADKILAKAKSDVESALQRSNPASADESFQGMSVCFTGKLLCTIGGQEISREVAERLAAEAGLTTASGVTKKLDVLVVADPNTQSGKAKKARKYGTRILADSVFWNKIGVTVD